jgi:hypothetical protein
MLMSDPIQLERMRQADFGDRCGCKTTCGERLAASRGSIPAPSARSQCVRGDYPYWNGDLVLSAAEAEIGGQ